MTARILLLSGGLDSVAALHWCREQSGTLTAFGFAYGQPHRDQELHAAGVIAARRGVPFRVIWAGECARLNPDAGSDGSVSKAFVPARNALLLTMAAMHAAPLGDFTIVMGANADDAAGFPDCRAEFFDAVRAVLRATFPSRAIDVETPWIQSSKADVLRWCASRPDAFEDARASVSCYRGTRCGTCDACALRARAFAEMGIPDGAPMYRAHGGDPHRERT